MSGAHLENVLFGCRQTLLQEKYLLESIDQNQYSSKHTPLIESSIGQHIRHIHDLWYALLTPIKQHGKTPILIDYDIRRRGHAVEKELFVGLSELRELLVDIDGLRQFSEFELKVKTEVGLDQCLCITTDSTLVRELAFVSSHATHHFALIKVIANVQGVELDRNVGVAPATRTFERELAN